jgi:hypothetical protein
MKGMVLLLLLGISAPALGAEHGPEAVANTSDWHTYKNTKYGYEIRYPDGFELWATGREGQRDGGRIRIALKERTAPTPVLDIYVRYDVTTNPEHMLEAEPPSMAVAFEDTEIYGEPTRQLTYRWKESGHIALLEVRRPGVLFRFHPSPGLLDIRNTPWAKIISTFRFLDK